MLDAAPYVYHIHIQSLRRLKRRVPCGFVHNIFFVFMLFRKGIHHIIAAAVCAAIVVFVVNFFVPREWIQSQAARSFVDLVARFFPALAELRDRAPVESSYMVFLGAVIWVMSPLFILLGVDYAFCDEIFDKFNSEVSARMKGNTFHFLLRTSIVLCVILFFVYRYFSEPFITHPGSIVPWMNQLSPVLFFQIVAWASIAEVGLILGAFFMLFTRLAIVHVFNKGDQ